MGRSLVIGYGNVYRRDDGVAFVVLNALRACLGRPALAIDDDGFDDLGHEVDTVLVHQLVPELADAASAYDQVLFVDAHVGAIDALLYEEELEAYRKSATVLHQLHPCSLLALIQELHDRAPRGVLVSVRGYDFEFGEGLSDETAALVPQAVARIVALTTAEG
ncbi:MAG: hydrogenase maturation protease [Anaerolineae bacterium]|nr:hydrogenase maturation protease [Anaerolineae bacterium]